MKTKTFSIRRAALHVAAFATITAPVAAKEAVVDPKPVTDNEALVQLAILLDTSNSMDGLIEQAKTQLWKIVNEFNGAKQGDKTPVVQVALYEYGNNNLSAGTNWIRQVLPFTRDLDKVSDELFKLTTNGGSEYCGAVIRDAIDKLEWDRSSKVYKAMFVAGNEPFTQGPISADESCKSAISKGVIVNTIHCGSESDGVNGGWRRGAHIAEGKFLTIDQDKAVAHIEAPQDKEISRLSIELNATYIGYGAAAPAAKANQTAQDSNAARYKSAGAEVQRAVTKSSANYSNEKWDLVDAAKKGTVKLEAVPAADLPKEMKELKPEERKAYVDQKSAEREKIQAEIRRLNEERQKFVAAKQKEAGKTDTLDTAISKVVREQASAKAQITFK
ncbi:MAG: VWA domain-containing protein [Verrucomicrobiaceae bacterium]|nr:VWA domain-containing protein [Verrucomicrobiaceae bacterium]